MNKYTIIATMVLSTLSFNVMASGEGALTSKSFNGEEVKEIKTFYFTFKNENQLSEDNIKQMFVDISNEYNLDIGLRRFLSRDYVSFYVKSSDYSESDIKNMLSGYSLNNIESDHIVRPKEFKNEPSYGFQYYMMDQGTIIGASSIEALREKTNMPNLPTSSGQSSIYNQRPTVAILDTGSLAHDDLYGLNIVDGYKFSTVFSEIDEFRDINDEEESDPTVGRGSYYEDIRRYTMYDDSEATETNPPVVETYNSCTDGHGLAMSGLMTAPANNKGISGVSDANLIFAKVMDTDCSSLDLGTAGTLTDLADAIDWVVGENVEGVPNEVKYQADIINMSLGTTSGTGCPSYLQAAINNAVSKGAILVAAAGNGDDSALAVAPGNCDNVITVSANDQSGFKPSFANVNAPVVDISVAGADLETPVGDGVNDTNSYESQGGTSHSAAIFSGISSLLKYSFPTMDNFTLKEVSKLTSGDFADPNCDDGRCGAGIVNADDIYEHITAKMSYTKNTSNYFTNEANGSCDRLRQQALGEYIDICALYYVDIENTVESEGDIYKVVRKSKDESKWSYSHKELNNIELVTEYELSDDNINDERNLFIDGVDFENFDYGIVICSDDICYPPKEIDFSSIDQDQLPNECQI